MTAASATGVTPVVRYMADGAQATFYMPWPIYSPENVDVYVNGTLVTAGFVVQDDAVQFLAPPASGDEIALRRHLRMQRATEFQENFSVRARTVNQEFDYQMAALQQLDGQMVCALRAPPLEAEADMALPPVARRAGGLLGFDQDGRPVAYAPQSIGVLPTGEAPMSYWRANQQGTGLEARSPGQVRADIGADRAENVRFHLPGVDDVERAVSERLGDTVFLTDFGASPDGSADSTAALIRAIAAAAAKGVDVWVPPGRYVLSGDAPILVDVGRCGLRSLGRAVFDCTAMTASVAFQLFGSRDYYDEMNSCHAFSGVALVGALVGGRDGILIGREGPEYRSSGDIMLSGVTVIGFDRNVVFASNAWRTLMFRCASLRAKSAHLYIPQGLDNFGEVMDFVHCRFADGPEQVPEVYIGTTAQVQMHSCSFLHSSLHVDATGAQVHLYGGNLENAGIGTYQGPTYPYIVLSQHTVLVGLHGTSLSINTGSVSGLTDTAAVIQTSLASQTVVMQGVTLPDVAPGYLPESLGLSRTFISGPAQVRAYGCGIWPMGGGHKLPLSAAANLLCNGDFETGTLTGWSIQAYGSGSASVLASARYANAFGLKLTGGTGINLFQEMAATPGEVLIVHVMARKLQSGTNWDGGVMLQALDPAGGVLAEQGIQATSDAWHWIGFSLAVPAGAAKVRLSLNAQAEAIIQFDNCIINRI